MPDTAPAAVLEDVYSFLDGLARERATPQAARERLQPLRERHPGAEIDVVWEAQSFDGSIHFDALIRPGSSKTISLSVCPDEALPWPLRGLQRWKDSDLLRVNGRVLSVADAIAQLDLLWERAPLMQRLIDHCVIRKALENDPVDVTDAEVQHAFDGMRRGRGLFSVADFEAWMKDSGVSLPTLEAMATQLAQTAKLRERAVGDRVDEVLANRLESFDVIALATVHVRSERQAIAVADEARRDGHGLLQSAQQVFARDGKGTMQTSLRRVRRHELDDSVRHAIAQACEERHGPSAGLLVGPVPAGDGYVLAEVLEHEPASTEDAELRRLAAVMLFDQWLCEQRRTARIEWFWGCADGTRHAGA